MRQGPKEGNELRYRQAREGRLPRGTVGTDNFSAEVTSGRIARMKKNRAGQGSGCPPCEMYQKYMKGTEQVAKDVGLAGIVKHPLFPYTQGNPIRDCFCEDIEVLKKLNKQQMSRSPPNALSGVIEELGELPIITLHKLQEKMEERSGRFFPPERGLARVCNPVGGSYLTARPFRCNTIYRYCEPVHSTYDGHVPGEQFIVGQHRGKSTRNATKYMTFRI